MKSFLPEVILVSGLLSGYYFLFLRNKQFHFFNRIYLLSALLVPVVIPFLHIPLELDLVPQIITTPRLTGSFISSGSLPATITVTEQAKTISLQNNPVLWLWLVYIIIALVLVMRVFFAFLRIARLLKAHTIQRIGNILVVDTTEQDAPFTFYKWLFWNNSIEPGSLSYRQIMDHEAVHIRQRHSIDIVMAEIMFAIFWINPFFYLIKKELKAVHEFLADSCITKDADKIVFANLLLQRAMGATTPLGHNFFGNITSRRINMLTFMPGRKKTYLQKTACIFLALSTLLLFSFEIVQRTSFHQPIIKSMPLNTYKNTKEKSRQLVDALFTPVFAADKSTEEENNINYEQSKKIIEQDTARKAMAARDPDNGAVITKENGDEISLLNYHDGAISHGIGMPADNIIPGFVYTRSDETQVIIAKGKNTAPVFFPARKYNELTLIFDKHHKIPLSDEWRLLVLITDEHGKPVKEETLVKEWITGFETVRISFKNLVKGTYYLQIKSNDQSYSTSCKVVKDFDG